MGAQECNRNKVLMGECGKKRGCGGSASHRIVIGGGGG